MRKGISYKYVYDLYRKLDFYDSCLTFCMMEIKSSRISTVDQALEIVNKASLALQDIECELGMGIVFQEIENLMEESGFKRAFEKAGLDISFDMPYQAVIARRIIIDKSHSIDTFDKDKWKGLYNLVKESNHPRNYVRIKFSSEILYSLSRYLLGEDRNVTMQNEINVLEEYRKNLVSLYSYHANPAFREFVTYSREGRGIIGEGAFSLDAINLKIDNLKAKMITKRKDSTILERQLAIDFMETLHKFGSKRIPAVVSVLMGAGFIKEIIDDRTIFRLWKSFNQSLMKVDEFHNDGKTVKRTTSYKHVPSGYITERFEHLRSLSYEFIKKVGLEGK